MSFLLSGRPWECDRNAEAGHIRGCRCCYQYVHVDEGSERAGDPVQGIAGQSRGPGATKTTKHKPRLHEATEQLRVDSSGWQHGGGHPDVTAHLQMDTKVQGLGICLVDCYPHIQHTVYSRYHRAIIILNKIYQLYNN